VQVTLRQIKKERTRQLISDTALRLFIERGYEQTTIDEIAMAAEVGTRTLYRYYPTKEDLLIKRARPGLRGLVGSLCERPDEEPLPQALYATMARFCNLLAIERKSGLALRALIEGTPGVRARWHDQVGLARVELAAEIRRRLRASRTDPRPDLAAGTLIVIMELVVASWATSRRNPLRVLDEVARLLNGGGVPMPLPGQDDPPRPRTTGHS
jgi:AcrR family transcriptional regulator